MKRFIWILILLACASLTATAQEASLDSLLETKSNSIQDEIVKAKLTENERVFYLGKFFQQQNNIDSSLFYLSKVDSTLLSKKYHPYYYYELGKLYCNLNFEDKGASLEQQAQEMFEKEGLKNEANRINYDLHYVFRSAKKLKYNGRTYLDKLYNQGLVLNDSTALYRAHLGYAALNFNIKKKDSFFYHIRKASAYNVGYRALEHQSVIESYIGLFDENILQNNDSAYYHLNQSLKKALEVNDDDLIFTAYVNMATLPRFNGHYNEAIKWMRKAEQTPVNRFSLNQKRNLYRYLSSDYKQIGNIDSAYTYLLKYDKYKDSVDTAAQYRNLTLLHTLEIEKEKDEAKHGKEFNRKLIIGLIIVLTLVVIIFLLVGNNLKKKKRLAENEKELQQQRIDNLMKEHELLGIDAMLEGQEKERKRIAMDLHDNLGSTLATLKLHFHNLKVRRDRLQEEENAILQKTDDLIDEAYQQVRSMAHAKNAGVQANEGLLPTVKNFAAKVSIANKLIIEVEDDGMDERLENGLEIAIFRIIQELITNVIKHSGAKEAIVHLTHHGDSINIMVEDNGHGFDTNLIINTDGMGLHNIQKRVEHLGGEFNIESINYKGTTVIIDIPLK
ncbi:sensor histidine kinase [Zhouia sp. PK063]|uniref:sensor histidine kinase n=1 Tax=Zhouia sp. PK063 TaxID=3373602 RepID=UPI003789B4F9